MITISAWKACRQLSERVERPFWYHSHCKLTYIRSIPQIKTLPTFSIAPWFYKGFFFTHPLKPSSSRVIFVCCRQREQQSQPRRSSTTFLTARRMSELEQQFLHMLTSLVDGWIIWMTSDAWKPFLPVGDSVVRSVNRLKLLDRKGDETDEWFARAPVLS